MTPRVPPRVVYDASGIVLWAGDCRDVMRGLVSRTIDHCLSDPPYEEEAHTKQRETATARSEDGMRADELDFAPMDDALRLVVGSEVARLVKRWALVFCQVEAVNDWRAALGHPYRQAKPQEWGLSVRRVGIWVKPDAQPQLTGDRPGLGFESIVMAHVQGKSRWNGGGRDAVFTHARQRGPSRIHLKQNPDTLMLELVSLFTDEGELVLDAFAGSGSTLLACRVLNRRAVGVELNPEMAEKAAQRLRDYDRQGVLFSVPAKVEVSDGGSDVSSTAGRSGIHATPVSAPGLGFATASSGDCGDGMRDRSESPEGCPPFLAVVNLPVSLPTSHKVDMLGAFHRCDAIDGRPYVYLPALDPSADDMPGGAKVKQRFDPLTVPPFDYVADRDGACWICAYADGLRRGAVEVPVEVPKEAQAPRVSLRDRLRELGILAKGIVAEVQAERGGGEVTSGAGGSSAAIVPTGSAVVDDLGYHRAAISEAPANTSAPPIVPPATGPKQRERKRCADRLRGLTVEERRAVYTSSRDARKKS